MAKKPVRGQRAAKSKAKSFEPCSRCQSKGACKAAGRCLAKSFG